MHEQYFVYPLVVCSFRFHIIICPWKMFPLCPRQMLLEASGRPTECSTFNLSDNSALSPSSLFFSWRFSGERWSFPSISYSLNKTIVVFCIWVFLSFFSNAFNSSMSLSIVYNKGRQRTFLYEANLKGHFFDASGSSIPWSMSDRENVSSSSTTTR